MLCAGDPMLIKISSLTYRTFDPIGDADLAAQNHYDACVASFGSAARYEGRDTYLRWLRRRVVEFPDGCVMAYLGNDFVGHLELEVPYGLPVGYINLYYVAAPFRRQGYGRRLHEYADRYFRAWEATRIDLHVSPSNKRAVNFYRKMGYKVSAASDAPGVRLWKMTKEVEGMQGNAE